MFGSKAKALCAVKFQKWKNALERFVNHESAKYHCSSKVTAETTTLMLSGKQDSIVIQPSHQRKQQILGNGRKVTPIIEKESFYETIGITVHLLLNKKKLIILLLSLSAYSRLGVATADIFIFITWHLFYGRMPFLPPTLYSKRKLGHLSST